MGHSFYPVINELEWMKEKVEAVEHNNRLYKLCCFFLGRRKKKLNYMELFLLFYGINKKALGHEDAERFASEQILKVYYFNNNKFPDNMKNE